MEQNNITTTVLAILIVGNIIGTLYLFDGIQTVNESIEVTRLSLQQQLVSDLSSLKEDFDGQLTLLETTQIATIDQMDILRAQIRMQTQDQSNELDALKDELISVQARSGADVSLLAQKVILSVVSIKTDIGVGSGVLVGSDGTIITNAHVMEGASAGVVVTHDKKTHSVQLIGSDSVRDIAVLKISSDDYDALSFADSDKVKVGQKVIAVGNPRGLDFTVTEGIISAKREVKGLNYIQTDVPINPGNSGGPLVDLEGNLVGINTFKVSESEGLGFALASNEVFDAFSDLTKG